MIRPIRNKPEHWRYENSAKLLPELTAGDTKSLRDVVASVSPDFVDDCILSEVVNDDNGTIEGVIIYVLWANAETFQQ